MIIVRLTDFSTIVYEFYLHFPYTLLPGQAAFAASPVTWVVIQTASPAVPPVMIKQHGIIGMISS